METTGSSFLELPYRILIIYLVKPRKRTTMETIGTVGPACRFTVLGLTLRLKRAQKPYIVWSLGPKALVYESLEP